MGSVLRFPQEEELGKGQKVEKVEKIEKVEKEKNVVNWSQIAVHLYKWTVGAILIATFIGSLFSLLKIAIG